MTMEPARLVVVVGSIMLPAFSLSGTMQEQWSVRNAVMLMHESMLGCIYGDW